MSAMIDVVIVGGGPVGATLALLAAMRGCRVCILEGRTGRSQETRSLALSHGSRVVLEATGVWPHLAAAATEIHTVHTSQAGGFGRVKLTRDDAGVPALGYVVAYCELQEALDQAMAAQGIDCRFGARVTAINQQSSEASVRYRQNDREEEVSGATIVLADGGANLDKLQDAGVHEKNYGQSAMLAYAISDRPHDNIAYERFTSEGPAALLPYDGRASGGEANGDVASRRFALVWVAPHARVDQRMALSEEAACDAFQAHFGRRAGRLLSIGERRRHPLRLRTVKRRVMGNAVVIGNAAQTLHPVAGQGFNLGLRDAEALADTLAVMRGGATTVGQALAAYEAARYSDVERGVAFTDVLVGGFLDDGLPMRLSRGLALTAVDILPLARKMLAQRMLFGALR